MKRSRACDDLIALETQKRNKIHESTTLTLTSLLTRSESAEEELARLLEVNAFTGYDRLNASLSLGLGSSLIAFDDDDDCLAHFTAPRAPRSASIVEKEAREAKEALQYKRSTKYDESTLQNVPASPSSVLRHKYFVRDGRSQMFDLSALSIVLEPHAA